MQEQYDIQSMTLMEFRNHRLIIVGCSKGHVRSFEVETGRQDGAWRAHEKDSDVVEVFAVPGCPLVFTCDNIGNFTMWSAPPMICKYQEQIR